MNTVLRSTGVLLLFVISITACRKPSDDPAGDPNKLRITRITQSTIREPQKVNVTDFIYDDQQRVDKIAYSYEETVNGNLNTRPGNSLKYYYNGTDKNPYKASGQVSNGWSADIFYSYNNASQLVRDSAKGSGTTEIKTRDYTYTSSHILVKRGNYNTSSTGTVYGNTSTDTILIKNNNIAEVVYQTGSFGLPGYYYKFSYDDKINPLSKLNIAAVKIVEGLEIFPDIVAPGICRNNMTAYTYGTISGGKRLDGEPQPYIFTYTKEGLPETCTITNRLETYTITYTYEEF